MSDNDIVKEFLIESYENLDRLDRELVELEKHGGNPETLASVFRTIHTIKGTCGFLGFNKLESVAHAGENLLSKLRDGQLKQSAAITTALLAMVDVVREMLAAIEDSGTEGERDDSELVATLTRLTRGESATAPAPAVATKIPAAAPPPLAAQPATAPQPPTTQAQVVAPSAPPESLAPSAPSASSGAAEIPTASIGNILIEQGSVSASEVQRAVEQQVAGDPRHLGEILVEHGAVKSSDIVDALQIQKSTRASTTAADRTIRVDVGLLDKLMNLVGELVLARNQVLQYTSKNEDTAFLATSQRLNLITTELQEGVMKTRMQPIGNIWGQFPRTVRDVATICGKQVRIEMEGRETELDKTIIEAIKDPLTHLVRNSVDHGVETPAARVAAGKDPEGRIFLRAFHEGGQVIIEISDDGAGLDCERVKRKAVDRGLITAEQAARMNDREVTNLIFLPGFSTAEKVTNVSGRGVGMDVVKTNIEKIGGTVDLQFKPGQGSTVRMKIPLTLAIIPALVVTSAGDRYAIPQVSLLELVRLEGDQLKTGIELVQGAPVYRLRGQLLPLVYLNRALDVEAAGKQNGAVNIVVLRADERQFGLIVDEVNDTEEIVVKPLGKQLKCVNTFAGATIMGDGRVALILDVLGIGQRANVLSELRDRAVVENHDAARRNDAEGDRETLLLFQCAGDSLMVLPLSMVSRLEEFPRAVIERTGQQEVVQYRGQIMPLVRISQVVYQAETAAGEQQKALQVVVYSEKNRRVGLVVDRILDIVEENLVIEQLAPRPGIRGSAVIQKRVADVLDVQGVVRAVHPQFFESRPPA
jgi:two-component system, chemotaxis family, sensor kinase CheA